MKKLIYLYFLFVATAGWTQSVQSGNSSLDYRRATEILPASPNASSFERYGGVGTHLSTGAVSKSISLKPFAFKGIQVPVTLSYLSNGIRVNEYASRVGIGWNFQAGGSISRVIYGYDDFTKTRYVSPINFGPNTDDSRLTTYCYNYFLGPYDSQPDVFSFHVAGYSGKFVFDHDNVIRQIPVSNVKIEYDGAPGATYKFTITTPDGMKYHFGAADAREKSKKGTIVTSFPSYSDNAWHLSKIVHPNGYQVTFAYEAQELLYKGGISETQYKMSNYADDPMVLSYTDDYGGVQTEYLYPSLPSASTVDEYVTSTVALLRSIQADDGSRMEFAYSAYGYPEKLIENITYYNYTGLLYYRYNLDYYKPNSVQENGTQGSVVPFLKSIVEADNNNKTYHAGYRFDYYDKTTMTQRVSKSQDHWGYYNGVYNGSLIPEPATSEQQNWFPSATADREPNPLYAVRGLLSRIDYPTGGYDEIVYEPNVTSVLKDANPYASAYQSIIGTDNDNHLPFSTGSAFTITYENSVRLTTLCEYTGTGTYDPVHHNGYLKVVNTATGAITYSEYVNPTGATVNKYITLPSGSYTLYVAARGVDMRINANIYYRTGTAPDPQPADVVVGGMRVKQATTTEVYSGKQTTTRYYYGTRADPEKSTAAPVPAPVYLRDYRHTLWGFVNNLCTNLTWKVYNHKVMYSNSLNQMYIYSGGPVNYQYVTESLGGNNFENGAIEHKYDIYYDLEAMPIRGDVMPGGPLTSLNYLSGRERETTVYKKIAQPKITALAGKTVYEYEDDDTNRLKDFYCYTIGINYTPVCAQINASGNVVGPFPMMHDAFSVQKYYLTSQWFYLKKKTETTYDEAGQASLTSITNYHYDDARNLMLSRIETTNSKNEAVSIQTKYAHDLAASGNVYEDMVNKYMIGLAVEKTSLKNGQPVSTQKNNFDNLWFGDKHIVDIQHVQMTKGAGSAESRYRYYKYDTYGNPLELSAENDVKQTLLWGYKGNFPIAKIMNADFTQVACTSFEEEDKGNWTYTGIPVYDASAMTGRKVYVLNGLTPVYKNGLSTTTTYLVSYWSKNGPQSVNSSTTATPGRTSNGWTYYVHKVVNPPGASVTVNGSGVIDELRLYPETAFVTTLTYDPGYGLTSETDDRNNITYYLYDQLGRLILIKDQDRNILKKYCYYYGGQPGESCNYYFNAEASQSYVKSCSTGYNGSTVTYTVPAGRYVSTVSQSEADQFAQNDLAAYGQAYANANGTCTEACTNSNCTGEDKKCIAGICRTGLKIYTGSLQVHGSLWQCTYHYEWSDGSWSQNYTEYKSTPCYLED